MARRIEFLVYLVGVCLLGLSYAKLKNVFSSQLLFAGLCVAYLLLLRLIGRAVARRWGPPPSD
jgi:hypothetical protein